MDIHGFMNAPSFHQKTNGFPNLSLLGFLMDYNPPNPRMGAPPHPPPCARFFEPLGDSFKYNARICRMAMRFVKARFEKHFRVPFLHTL